MRNRCLVAVGLGIGGILIGLDGSSSDGTGFFDGGVNEAGSRLSQSKSHDVLGRLGLNSCGFFTR